MKRGEMRDLAERNGKRGSLDQPISAADDVSSQPVRANEQVHFALIVRFSRVSERLDKRKLIFASKSSQQMKSSNPFTHDGDRSFTGVVSGRLTPDTTYSGTEMRRYLMTGLGADRFVLTVWPSGFDTCRKLRLDSEPRGWLSLHGEIVDQNSQGGNWTR
ncbi:hypothetical protein WR25_25063 [Diploscapter pachys]|uniref:Uncharacterized protein n=1 Tax=Diploscapter pachys TaxID=2018661 RepID=A0A2A2KQD1_9BILA|nr:hypothetical protein WR25_25063 [Diploscapter pachys]